MGLLDSDAEELKRNKSGEATSGRKVNQSGLGALKGLSKYSNLTAKYRTTGKPEESTPPSVEQSRGTESKSVQSPGEVSATEAAIVPPVNTELPTEVSAKSVQSPSKTTPPPAPAGSDPVESSLAQSPCEVGAKSVQSRVDTGMTPTALETAEASAKSVQEKVVDVPLPAAAIDALSAERVSSPPSEVSAKSVQNEDVEQIISNLNQLEEIEVSAKSVQPLMPSLAEQDQVSTESLSSKSVQSQDEVGAKSVHPAAEVRASAFVEKTVKVRAKSVQSPGKIQLEATRLMDFKVGAKSVQNNPEVSAKSVRSAAEVRATTKNEKANKVGAKSVQSPGEVRAISVEHLDEVPRMALQQKSKVSAKDLSSLTPTESVISISGSQRVIVDFLFQLCLWNNSLITPPITKQQLTSETGLLEETALSSIKRLRIKNIIDRYAYKDGKAGWTQYQFSESSYKELLHLRQVSAKSVQSPGEFLKPPSYTPHSPPVEAKKPVAEPNWFKNLDFSKVHPIGPMVVNSAIRALVQENLNAEMVQDFINRFTSWTSTQGRITSPIGLFCDKLKELAKEGDSPVFACMTDEEREIEAAYAAQVEKVKAEMELIRKARSETLEQQEVQQFESWYATATDDDKAAFAETSALAPAGSEAYKRLLKVVYLEKLRAEGV